MSEDGAISEETLRFVLSPIQTSHFYLPTRKELNDPSEGLLDNKIMSQVHGFLTSVIGFGERQDLTRDLTKRANEITDSINSTGVFSLTTDPTDELMWAHYANSHCGIAVEYDLEKLTRFAPGSLLHQFPITYSQKPPSIGLNDIEPNKLMKNMLGYKSKRWTYECEYRVLVDNVNGTFPHDYHAIKSITFGIRVEESIRQEIIELTKHKVPAFYEIKDNHKNYGFVQVPISKNELPVSTTKLEDTNWDEFIGHLDPDIQPTLKKKIINMCRKDNHFKKFLSVAISTIKPDSVCFQYYLHHGHKILPGQDLMKEYTSLS